MKSNEFITELDQSRRNFLGVIGGMAAAPVVGAETKRKIMTRDFKQMVVDTALNSITSNLPKVDNIRQLKRLITLASEKSLQKHGFPIENIFLNPIVSSVTQKLFSLVNLPVATDISNELLSKLKQNIPVDEMALARYQPIGDFDKPGPFRGADKRLIPHPKSELKTQQFFENTPYDFRLFFSNIPGTGRFSEYGPMGPNEIRNNFSKEVADQLIDGSEDAITVLFVGNKGDAKVMMTPWIMAHRIGHAIQAGVTREGKSSAWLQAEQHFFKGINKLLKDFYGIERYNLFSTVINWQMRQAYSALFNAIGTQRSSRTGKITRPYEFLYELFAQYLGTGTITLNPLPKQRDYGRKAWGRSTQSLRMKSDMEEESKYTTEVLARDMELMFDDVLSSMVGKIYIM